MPKKFDINNPEDNGMMMKGDIDFMIALGHYFKDYNWLEVGTYYGQSLPYQLLNPNLKYLMALDLYPESYPDERNKDHVRGQGYNGSPSFEKVYDLLNHWMVPTDKMETFQGDLAYLPVTTKYDIIFIDAEHTNAAAFRDGMNALKHLKETGCILFHDTTLVHGAIDCFNVYLKENGYTAERYKIKHSEITCFTIGDVPRDLSNWLEKGSANYDKFKINAKIRIACWMIKNHPFHFEEIFGMQTDDEFWR